MVRNLVGTYRYNDHPRTNSLKVDLWKIDPDRPFAQDPTVEPTTHVRCETWSGEEMPN